jgi:hypothetical protein
MTNILEDAKIWFLGGMLNIHGVRVFYQCRLQLLQNGFLFLFGAKFQEIYVKTMREMSDIGQFVSNNAKAARFDENGIL